MTDHEKEFWNRLTDVTAGMLGLDRDSALVPMSPMLREDRDGKVWFITADGTDLVNGVATGAQSARFVVADGKAGLWADVDGMLALENDAAVLDELWTPMAAAWFDDGRQDPDVRLLSFTPKKAEASFTEDSAIRFFFEIAKANMTEQTPDAGWQGTITF